MPVSAVIYSQIRALVVGIQAGDPILEGHRIEVLTWLDGTDDVFRRQRPATPPQHLVAYVLPVDPATGAVLIGDHRRSGLWLPPGGHVEPGEHPADTAGRELAEELGLEVSADHSWAPSFLSVAKTRPPDVHTDVSLWFCLPLLRSATLTPDPREFGSVRWWDHAELAAADPERLDPHLGRFVAQRADPGRNDGARHTER